MKVPTEAGIHPIFLEEFHCLLSVLFWHGKVRIWKNRIIEPATAIVPLRGEGGADILNAAGESIGNIFDTFVSPVLYAIQWILIILIILYLLRLRSENRENVMVRNRWGANNINTGN
jgi:hypothetical protein